MSKRKFITLTDKYTSKKKAINIDNVTSYEEKDDYVSVYYTFNGVEKYINANESFVFIKYIINKSDYDIRVYSENTSNPLIQDNTIYDDKLRFTDTENESHCYLFCDIKTEIKFIFSAGIIFFGIGDSEDFQREQYTELFDKDGITFLSNLNLYKIGLHKNDFLKFTLSREELNSVRIQYGKYKSRILSIENLKDSILKEENENIYQQDSSI